ncbi:MAG: 50S ribosomal protein L3 [Elusimicrobia bacterium]|nr:50S ribosomal protein L3 [Elusimicrobiota bacterium]
MTEQTNETPAAEAKPAEAKTAPATLRALLGEKVGMTQLFTPEGELKGVTVVKAGPCAVLQVKKADGPDGYAAVLIGFGAKREKSVNKPEAGLFKKAGVAPVRHLREFRVKDAAGFEPGQTMTLEGRFAVGDYVDVQGTTKGLGFQGAMKRHGFGGLPGSHGASDKERSPGSLASRRSLGRVVPGQRMAGHTGAETCTTEKVAVVRIEAEKNLIYLNGPVPGPAGGVVALVETNKNLKRVKAPPKTTGVKKDKMGNIIQPTADKKKAKK